MRFADPTYSAHVATGTNVGHILFIQHLVEVGYAPVGVRYLCAVSTRAVAADAGTHDGVLYACRRGLVANLDDVVYPLVVLLQGVGRDAYDLDVPRAKLGCAATGRPPRPERAAGRGKWRSGAHRCEMSASSVVHTGVKSPGCEKNIICVCVRWVRPGGLGSLHGGEGRTHESPIQSWNLMCPSVVSASKSGATLPRRRVVVEDIGAGP